jgi:hypothetical protein
VAFALETGALLPHLWHAHTIAEAGCRLGRLAAAGPIFSDRRFVMRRTAALCAATCIAVAAVAVVSPAEAGYYVIRWENTGICQIWNESLTSKPWQWPSTYKVVSKPVPTLAAAMSVQEKMRLQHRCTL